MRPKIYRSIQRTFFSIGVLMSALMLILIGAAVKDDAEIDSHLGRATADVLSASPQRSAVSFYTPGGTNHNPKVGVLYPSNLTAGDQIPVEYSTKDPNLVRVAGRDARYALIPALSVAGFTWLVVAIVMVSLAEYQRRSITAMRESVVRGQPES